MSDAGHAQPVLTTRRMRLRVIAGTSYVRVMAVAKLQDGFVSRQGLACNAVPRLEEERVLALLQDVSRELDFARW